MSAIGQIVIGMKVQTGGLNKGLSGAAQLLKAFESRLISLEKAVKGLKSGMKVFNSGLAQTRKELAAIGKDALGFAKSLTKVGSNGMFANMRKGANSLAKESLALGSAISVGISAPFIIATTNAFNNIDALQEEASQLGTTSDKLSALSHAANISGSSSDYLNTALEKMNKSLGGFEEGDTASKALETLGLNAEELSMMDPTDAFKKISKAIGGVQNPAQKTALAMDIFGKSAGSVLNLMNNTEGIDKLEERARKLHVSISQVDAAKIGEAKDTMDEIFAALQGVGNVIAINLSPYIVDLGNRFLDWMMESDKVTNSVKGGLKVVALSVGIVADVIHTMKLGFMFAQAGITHGIAYIVDGFNLFGKAIESVINLLPGMSVEFDSVVGEIAKDLHKLGNEQLAEFNKEFVLDPPSKGINDWFEGIKKAQENTYTIFDNTKTKVAEVTEEFKKMKDGVKDLESSLKNQIQTWGQTGAAADIAKLKEQGATDEMLSKVKDLDLELQALAVKDSLKKPFEIFAEEAHKLDRLRTSGKLTDDEFDKALNNKRNEIMPENKAQFASAIDVNSQAGREFALKQIYGINKDNPAKAVEKAGEKQLAKWDMALPKFDEICKALTTPKVVYKLPA